MKKTIVGIVVVILFIGMWIIPFKAPQQPKSFSPKTIPSPTIAQVQLSNKILFVPYWTIGQGISSSYDEYIYFGITPDDHGISTSDEGYTSMHDFLRSVPAQSKKILGVRMTDGTVNETVLHDGMLQQKIIADTEKIAKENNFDGILFDLEYNALPFDSVVESINDFSRRFATGVKSQQLLFYQTMYGDSYYRGRPFSAKDLARNADKILVMAYDFHKSNGDPGPNFPLEMGSDDYSFTTMLNNFTADVPRSKLSIIFGMFGYDWKLNEKGNSLGQAESLSDNVIIDKFLIHCPFLKCSIQMKDSSETHVEYTDTEGKKHEVWFEDKKSVEKKEKVVEQSGISSVGFWANGYF